MNTNSFSCRLLKGMGILVMAFTGGYAQAATIALTEWMYNPVNSPGEFLEFTNMSNAPIDMTGWSFDDNSRAPGSESLSGFGIVQAGESVIFTESTASAFRAAWNLAPGIKVVGGNTNNLGRADEINLYDASNALVDRLTFDDQGTGTVKGPRTQGTSGRPSSASAIGANNASLWVLSTVGDVDGAYRSTGTLFDIGSPGKTSFAPAPVPIPAALWLMGSALVGFVGIGRRRNS